MYPLKYLWSKILKKARGTAIIDSTLDVTAAIESGSTIIGSSFGKNSFCGYDCSIINCEIGKYCSLADNIIIGGARHPMEWVGMSSVFYSDKDSIKKKYSEFERPEDKKTVIENDVWIGTGAIIIQGVRICNGAVVGAGAVVTHDVKPYEIVAGNPAKHIRFRFSDEIINDLLEIKWWDLSDEELSKVARYIKEPIRFISEFKK